MWRFGLFFSCLSILARIWKGSYARTKKGFTSLLFSLKTSSSTNLPYVTKPRKKKKRENLTPSTNLYTNSQNNHINQPSTPKKYFSTPTSQITSMSSKVNSTPWFEPGIGSEGFPHLERNQYIRNCFSGGEDWG